MKRLVLLVLGLLALAAPAHATRARLSAADRAAINQALDVFVPAAIARRHPERAFSVVTPHLRQNTKRAEWARGNLPVTPYPAVGKRFHACMWWSEWRCRFASRLLESTWSAFQAWSHLVPQNTSLLPPERFHFDVLELD